MFPFQEIVNTYGVPLYKEINPGIFAAVTFPFLFGVMFGDVFHGLILLAFAVILCFKNFEYGSLFRELKRIRYLLLLMGFFSTFCGIIYNDFASIPLHLAGPSCYNIDEARLTRATSLKQINSECVYPVGVDPAWYLAKNELTYLNSLKMKIAVILGVA